MYYNTPYQPPIPQFAANYCPCCGKPMYNSFYGYYAGPRYAGFAGNISDQAAASNAGNISDQAAASNAGINQYSNFQNTQ